MTFSVSLDRWKDDDSALEPITRVRSYAYFWSVGDCTITLFYCPVFTCGRRPTGHVMMAVIVVVVVVGGGGGGGEQLLYMGPPRAHVWSIKI